MFEIVSIERGFIFSKKLLGDFNSFYVGLNEIYANKTSERRKERLILGISMVASGVFSSLFSPILAPYVGVSVLICTASLPL